MFAIVDSTHGPAEPPFEAEIPLDRATQAWLCRVALANGLPPGVVIAAMLRDIRVDDEATHRPEKTFHPQVINGGRSDGEESS